MTDGTTAPVSIEALSRMSSVHCPVIAVVSTVSPINGSSNGQVPGFFHCVELTVRQILDPGREPVAQQMAEAEILMSRAGGVGVMLDDAQIGLVSVMVQTIEHVGRFAHRCRNDPRVKSVHNGRTRACREQRRGRCRIWR